VLSLICASEINERKLYELFIPLFQKNDKTEKKFKNEKNDKGDYVDKSNIDRRDTKEERLNENKEHNDENNIKNKSQKYQIRQLLGLNSPSKIVPKNLDLIPEETAPLNPGSSDNNNVKPDILLDNDENKTLNLSSNESIESDVTNETGDKFYIANLNKEITNTSEITENLKKENLKIENFFYFDDNLDLNSDISIEDICEYISSTPVLNEFLESQIRYIMYQLIMISNKCSI
jgi:hypothetical protein